MIGYIAHFEQNTTGGRGPLIHYLQVKAPNAALINGKTTMNL